jgi:Domain of unknown function (DUF4136)
MQVVPPQPHASEWLILAAVTTSPHSSRESGRTRFAAGCWLSALLLVAACANPITVRVDVDPDANIAGYDSYAWISDEPLLRQVNGIAPDASISPIDDQRIRRAVDANLQAKGWHKVESVDEADLVVSYGIRAQEKTDVYETPGPDFYVGRGYRYGGWYAGSLVRSDTYTEGTLTIQFFDRRTKQASWVGWASQRLSASEVRDEVIETAVRKILKDFPSRS